MTHDPGHPGEPDDPDDRGDPGDPHDARNIAELPREHRFGERGMPIVGHDEDGVPIPDLARIPKERWREALAPLPHPVRRRATRTVDYADISAALVAVAQLELEDAARMGRSLEVSPRLPVPDPGPRPTRPLTSRQVNLRLGPDSYDRLARAASLHGCRPTELARVLTMRGVSRMLAEQRRDEQPGGPWSS